MRAWTEPFPFMIVNATLAFYVGILALIAVLVFRGGLVLLIAGVTFVRRDGARRRGCAGTWPVPR